MNEEMCEKYPWKDPVEKMKHHFFLMMPLRMLQSEDFHFLKTEASQKNQEILFQMLFGSTHANLFKVATKYKRSFLKKLINEIESDGCEVIEELYNTYVKLLTMADANEEFAFKSYFLSSLDVNIVIKESTQMISSGTTGLVSWEACYTLCEWVLSNDQIFNNRVVLELGSGPGLLGILICKACNPRTYIFSDHHEKVLELLCDNIRINSLKLDAEELKGDNNGDVFTEDNETPSFESFNVSSKVLRNSGYSKESNTIVNCDCCRKSDVAKCKAWCWKLDWQSRDCIDILEKGNIDVVIGSDLVFDLSLIPSLVSVLARVLRKSTKIKSYIGTTIRSEETYSYFLEYLDSYQLQWKLVDMDNRVPLFNYQKQCKVEVLEIMSRE